MVKVWKRQRDVPETVSTKEITALGHELPTYEYKFLMKLGVVLNIEVVHYPYPSITLAFDTSRVFDLWKKLRPREILFIRNKGSTVQSLILIQENASILKAIRSKHFNTTIDQQNLTVTL